MLAAATLAPVTIAITYDVLGREHRSELQGGKMKG